MGPPRVARGSGRGRGRLEGRLPRLIKLEQIRGDLQMHSKWSDGQNTIEEMERACLERGYEYIAMTDHSKAATVAKGLDPKRLKAQWREIQQVNRRVRGIRVLRALEVDILRDGSLDLPDEYLDQLELVVASVHSNMGLSRARMTDRIISAISHPSVDILGHATGRILNRRRPYELDVDAVLEAAAELGVAVEVNGQPDRLDLSDVYVRRALELGVKIAINSDAHSAQTLRYLEDGLAQARRGWVEKKHVLNTLRLPQLRDWLARRRRKAEKRPAPRKAA